MRKKDADELIKILRSIKYRGDTSLNRLLNNEIDRCISFVETAPEIPDIDPDPVMQAMYESKIAELKRKLNDDGDHYCNGLSRLYVLDKTNGRIHRIGDDRHDALDVREDGIHYHNLQNGDGGSCEDVDGYGYVIIRSESGFLNDGYVESFSDSDGHIYLDKRFTKEIEAYIKECEDDGRIEGNPEDRSGSEK